MLGSSWENKRTRSIPVVSARCTRICFLLCVCAYPSMLASQPRFVAKSIAGPRSKEALAAVAQRPSNLRGFLGGGVKAFFPEGAIQAG